MIKKYKTKPCEIEAIQWDGSNDIGYDMGCAIQDAYETQIEDSYSEPDWAIAEITDIETPFEKLREDCNALSYDDFIEKYCKK
jgi:hypothetical protein